MVFLELQHSRKAAVTRCTINPILAIRTCPVAAENAEDNLLLKNDFLEFSRYSGYILGKVDESKTAYIKFIQDSVYQNYPNWFIF